MSGHPLGVDVDDFKLAPKEALRQAAKLAFRDVELATVAGDVAPANLSTTGRRHLTRYVDGLGLRLTSLVADLPGSRLTDPSTMEQRLQETCEILELAADLGVPLVTASVGAVIHPETGEPSPLVSEALRQIGEFADIRGRIFAIRPSQEGGDRLAQLIDALGCPAIRIGLDPAAMVMSGINPVDTINRLGGQIALVHVRDGTVGSASQSGHETRLGEGEVDLRGVLAALSAVEYRGAYVIRRVDSRTPIADIEQARTVLSSMLPPG